MQLAQLPGYKLQQMAHAAIVIQKMWRGRRARQANSLNVLRAFAGCITKVWGDEGRLVQGQNGNTLHLEVCVASSNHTSLGLAGALCRALLACPAAHTPHPVAGLRGVPVRQHGHCRRLPALRAHAGGHGIPCHRAWCVGGWVGMSCTFASHNLISTVRCSSFVYVSGSQHVCI